MKFTKDQQITIGGRYLAIRNLRQSHVFKIPVRSYEEYKKGHTVFMQMIENEEMHTGVMAKTHDWSKALREKNKSCWDLLRKELPFLFE